MSNFIHKIFFFVTICFIPGLTWGGAKVVDPSLVDESVSPCEDFFEYACGQWLKKTPIPSDRAKLYRFSEIDINTEQLLHDILKRYHLGNFTPRQKYAGKMGDFYGACMNESKADVAGHRGIQGLLGKIQSLQKSEGSGAAKDLAKLVAELHLIGIPAFFNFYADQDPGNATQVIAQIDQGGLGLPEKGYYLDTDDEMVKTRRRYLKHLKNMFKMVDLDSEKTVKSSVQKVFNFERELAKTSLGPIERRNPQAIYHKMTLEDLSRTAPGFDWSTYFAQLGLQSPLVVNVMVPEFFQAFAKKTREMSRQELIKYLQWQAVHAVAEVGPRDIIAENFDFYGRFLSGQKAPRPRWKQCVASVDAYLGEALGEAFVEVAFSPEAKKLAASMMDQIQGEVQQMFGELDWMDQHTREGAIKKLNTLVKKVGYPEISRNYDSYFVRRDSWFQNVIAGNKFEISRRIAKIGKPVDRGEWGMTASTNNAYYNPTLNEIVFPAGILQDPLFSIEADLAANYGATGATIGHEISHGFDDEGRQFDENGDLKDWWSEGSTLLFNKKAQCIVKQYDQYKVADGVPVQGQLTLGENIADLGGLKIALRAYQSATETEPKVEDYQRFFIAYAQSWCGKATPEYEKNVVQFDPHSPARFRVNGVVVNMPEFSQAFSCQDGQAMKPQNRCEVW